MRTYHSDFGHFDTVNEHPDKTNCRGNNWRIGSHSTKVCKNLHIVHSIKTRNIRNWNVVGYMVIGCFF